MNYNTQHRKTVLEALPKKGFIDVTQLVKKTGLKRNTIYYQLRTIDCIRTIKTGLRKHRFFINNRIDKWLWLKITRIARRTRQVMINLRNVLLGRSINELKSDERRKVVNQALKN